MRGAINIVRQRLNGLAALCLFVCGSVCVCVCADACFCRQTLLELLGEASMQQQLQHAARVEFTAVAANNNMLLS